MNEKRERLAGVSNMYTLHKMTMSPYYTIVFRIILTILIRISFYAFYFSLMYTAILVFKSSL